MYASLSKLTGMKVNVDSSFLADRSISLLDRLSIDKNVQQLLPKSIIIDIQGLLGYTEDNGIFKFNHSIAFYN
jgi:hypothetical protein